MSDWADEMKGSLAKSKEHHDAIEKLKREYRAEMKELKRELRKLKRKTSDSEEVEKLKRAHQREIKKLMLQINRDVARLTAVESSERKEDNRRVYIEGRLFRLLREERPELEQLFQERLEGYLKESDRWLFGFEEEESSG